MVKRADYSGRILMLLLSSAVLPGQLCNAQKPVDFNQMPLSYRIPAVPGIDPLPGSAKVYSLPQLVDLGERSNPQTRIAWEQATQAAEGIGIARSALLPTLAFTTMALRGDLLFGLPPNLSSQGVIKLNNEILEPAVTLSWTIFDFGGDWSMYQRAKVLALASKLSLNATNEKVALQISKSYYQLLASKEQLQAASVSNEASSAVEKSVQVRFNNGLATIVQLDQAKAQRLQSYSQFVKAKGSVASGKVSLAASVGLTAGEAVDIDGLNNTPSPTVIRASANDLVKQALASRPELMEAADEVKAAQYAAKSARSDLFPKITLDAEEQYTDSKNLGNSNSSTASNNLLAGNTTTKGSTYVIAARLQWTLFDWGARRDRLRQAQSQVREAGDRLASSRIDVEQEVWNAYVSVVSALEQQDSAKASLDAATELFRASREAYDSGTSDLLNLISSQTSLSQANSAYAEARTNTLEAATELAYSTGDLLAGGPKLPEKGAKSQ